MNLPEIRHLHPLAFVATATAVAVVCFSVIPGTTLKLAFAQTALAAVGMLALLGMAQPEVLSCRHRPSRSKLTASCPHHEKTPAFVVILLLTNGLFVGVVAALGALGKMPGENTQMAIEVMFASAGSMVLFFALCGATGVFEEGLFRGVMFGGFTDALRAEGRKNPALTGGIASAFVFGLLHTATVPIGELATGVVVAQLVAKTIQATLFGFVMSAVFLKTQNLWIVVSLHTGFNILSMGPAFMVTGQLPTTYATADPIDLVVLLVSILLLVPLVVYAWRVLTKGTLPCVR